MDFKILVAEEIWANQLLMKTLLTKLGYTTHIAANGTEALQKLVQTAFYLVCMDSHIPEMDGLEATKTWRQDEGWQDKHIPIVALTVDVTTKDHEKCLANGLDNYLNKPFKLEQIADMINKWGNKEKRA